MATSPTPEMERRPTRSILVRTDTRESELADYPCDWHHERYLGDSTRVFMNLYRGDEKAAFRASVCGQCLADIVTDWLSSALVQDPRGFWRIPDGAQTLEDVWQARRGPTEAFNGARRP